MSIFRFINPINIILHFWSHRNLIKQFTKREILSRYRGSNLGLLWSVINPLIMLTVYTFVFSVVFKGKWGITDSTNQFEFAIIMFCGIIAYNIFNETINRAPTLIIGNVNYVKKVIFPLEILPITIISSSLVHSFISLIILILMSNFLFMTTTWTIILFPIVMAPLVFFTLGFTWFLSSLGVYVRDIGYTVIVLTNILFYITPIFYPITAVPEFLRIYMYFNPLTTIVESLRQIVLWGQVPYWPSIILLYFISYSVMVIGLTWFMKTRKGFADVL